MIKLAAPDIRPDDLRRAIRCLRSGNLVQGKYVARFEEALAEFTGQGPCAVVSSGTAALHLAALAIDLAPGDGVVVPAFTFPATANVVERVGAKTILCDVDPVTYVATASDIEQALRSQPAGSVKAVIVVHEFGYPADIAAVEKLARQYGARLIEDAACALGTIASGHHPGRFGDVACLSFHPRKAITTGEGGAFLARDPELLARAKELRNHGIRVSGSSRDFCEAGFNYRMTDFQAALGLGQLARFGRDLVARRALAARYFQLLRDESLLRLPASDPGHSWQTFMVVLAPSVDRATIVTALRADGIECGPGAQALHCLQYFRERYGHPESAFPVAAELFARGLALPLHGRLRERDIDRVCQSLRRRLHASSR